MFYAILKDKTHPWEAELSWDEEIALSLSQLSSQGTGRQCQGGTLILGEMGFQVKDAEAVGEPERGVLVQDVGGSVVQ